MEPFTKDYIRQVVMNLVYGTVLPDTEDEISQSRVKDKLISQSNRCNSYAYQCVYCLS